MNITHKIYETFTVTSIVDSHYKQLKRCIKKSKKIYKLIQLEILLSKYWKAQKPLIGNITRLHDMLMNIKNEEIWLGILNNRVPVTYKDEEFVKKCRALYSKYLRERQLTRCPICDSSLTVQNNNVRCNNYPECKFVCNPGDRSAYIWKINV